MINVTLYVRKDCHLCEKVIEDLQRIQKKITHHLVIINIDEDSAIKDLFSLEIPVVEVGPYRLKSPFSSQELEMTLAAASDRISHLEKIGSDDFNRLKTQSSRVTKADRISYWISKHYLLLVNLFVILYLGIPFLAPVLKKVGADSAAEIVYRVYKPLCHQWSFRSWFLFGEQPYYPHAEADIPGVITFEEATGITDINDPSRILARDFEGNDQLGYKVALCERDVAIWGAFLLFGLIFAISNRKIKGLNWGLWIIIGILPVGLDGVSQVISQFNLPFFEGLIPYRESTPILRTLTGFLFGFMTAWFGYPSVEDAMRDNRRILAKKIAVVESKSIRVK